MVVAGEWIRSSLILAVLHARGREGEREREGEGERERESVAVIGDRFNELLICSLLAVYFPNSFIYPLKPIVYYVKRAACSGVEVQQPMWLYADKL